ncbi:MAG TPA: hypothetical protein VFA89_02290 [Terriglobales bacterium]|nr:hypothetical protein [Terriglobales bacterium]
MNTLTLATNNPFTSAAIPPRPFLFQSTPAATRTTGKDAGIKNFAQSTLPTLQEHLKLAEQITPKQETRAAK